jgi:Domain of unknown function (DUF4136)
MKNIPISNVMAKMACIFTMLLLVILVSGCNSIKVTSDFDRNVDFKTFKTYTFSPSLKNIRLNSDNKEVLEMAIDREMKARGYQKSNSLNTDLLIDLFLKYDAKVDVTGIPNNDMYDIMIYGYGIGFSNTSLNYHEFAEGTLFIRFVDAKKNLEVWEGRGSTNIESKKTDLEKEKLINNSVNKIFKNYPVKAQ